MPNAKIDRAVRQQQDQPRRRRRQEVNNSHINTKNGKE